MLASIHPPTLLLALMAGFALLSLVLLVAGPGLAGQAGLREWQRGCWLLLAALLVQWAGLGQPAAWTLVPAVALLALGLAMLAQALHRLLRAASAPRWVWQLAVAAGPLMLLTLVWPAPLRTGLASLLLALLLWPALRLAWRRGAEAERSWRTVALALALSALGWLWRGLQALGEARQPADAQAAGPGELLAGLPALVALAALLAAGIGFVLTITERVNQQLQVLASHDELTGCLNRSALDTLVGHALRRAHREAAPLAFVLLDIDHFTQINLSHGHRVGDAVLQRFAQVVQQRLRASDAFGRVGGEEFGLLLPGTDAAGARVLVESVRQAVEQMPLHDLVPPAALRVTVSAGVAIAQPGAGASSADRLYGRADQSLYEAKRAGRNRVEVYGSSNSVQGSLLTEP